MSFPGSEQSRGILNPAIGATKFSLTRHQPSADFAPFVERYWIVCWNLSSPFEQHLLNYPCINAAIERGKSGVFGISSVRGSRTINGTGMVFGIKFRPGGFYPFIQTPVSELTDSEMGFAEAFNVDPLWLEDALETESDLTALIAIIEDALRPALPEVDPVVDEINQVVNCIIGNPTIVRVDDLLSLTPGWSKRHLQRLFHRYVGVSPKWVIQRYRLQEAAEQLAHNPDTGLATLAHQLGYFDQAHFSKDFKAVVGTTPAQYVKSTLQQT